ncbi:hypothetical protein EOI86_23605 [Hwanghaeella grinnelliae]|uniref:Polysaccharide pyruvyl transferase domain-containing protein n=1 Tax=Hwanghaeella grinnelliae TaxID=2500179 RepID=A0A3S2W736_9PROT|nr:polysaccharide pyruvyl transferase family protein [Hwanghaeella grinnelliae]RVU34103.1 hypothetical protein EOI86_23605 [Hwanghaeella grinnelliae]
MTRIAIFGAAPDTMNLGVSALLASMLDGLSSRLPTPSFLVFDNKLGSRQSTIGIGNNQSIDVALAGARVGNRYYLPENLGTMATCAKVGGPFVTVHPILKDLQSCDAILNISGGDSFSDIYGPARFSAIVRPMQIAHMLGIPLILPPQTYGPYKNPGIRDTAANAVKRAEMCWARDENSFEILKDLLGTEFNPDNHLCGVDVAFGLAPSDAHEQLPEPLKTWIRDGEPMAGINVSGLIYLDPVKAKDHYGFRADYETALVRFATKLLETTQHKLVLVPHVMQPFGNYESDGEACEALSRALPEVYRDRIVVSPMNLDQSQAKWVISKMEWFCGTRMHSTIASLSSGVATASIVYSDKANGVFASCGQESHALDPRLMNTDDIVEELLNSFTTRIAAKESLSDKLPSVLAKAQQQMDMIAARIRNASGDAKRGHG